MKITLLFVILAIMASGLLHAQHEADNWYFGDYAGISFSTGSPAALSDGKMQTWEGCASISDKTTGKLIFYTNGVSIWNNKHQIIKNGTGLKGGNSSAQSALIIPHPGIPLQYYVFTVSQTESNEFSLFYSLVSMESPTGEVLTKNTMLMGGVSEKLTGTLDCAGTGYWVVVHSRVGGIFHSYHINSSGVESRYTVSYYTSTAIGYEGGYLKISPNRSKIALVAYGDYKVELFDFNAKTGQVTNNMSLTYSGDVVPYGLSFSPDNSKLYASFTTPNWLGVIICQYDLSLPTATLIQNSLYIITQDSKLEIATFALQLAPNGKIYCTQFNQPYLNVIENPNAKGSSCRFVSNAVTLTNNCQLGLPNFMDYIFNQSGVEPLSPCSPPQVAIQSDSSCVNNTLQFKDKSKNGLRRVWTFEGGTPSTSTDSIVTVRYAQAGTHTVILRVENDNGSVSDTAFATVYPLPTASAGIDRTICKLESTELGDKPQSGNKYSWLPTTDLDNPNIANPNASPKSTTQYILTFTSEHGCIAYDTVLVTVGNIVAKVSNDTTICSGTSVQLLASGGANYTWTPTTGLSNPNIENPIASPNTTTNYKVNVSSGTCEDSAFVTITVNPQPTANAGPDKTLCIGASTEIGEAAQAGFTYQWQPTNGLDDATKSNPTASPTNTTQYILTVSGKGGCTSSDTVLVTIGTIKAIVSNDTSICEGSSAKLFASGGAKYEWSPSTGLDNPSIATPTANPTITTKYKVIVSSGTCIDSAFVTINILPPPNANAGSDTAICVGASMQIGTPAEAGNSYSWSPSTGLASPTASQTTASPATTTTYTLQVTNPAGCVKSDEVIVTVNSRNERSFTLQPDTVTILPGKQFTTSLEIPSGVADWSVKLKYDPLLITYKSITGAQAIPDDLKGELLVNGNGGSRSIPITFDAYLPHTSDTIYPVKLSVDTSKVADCETWSAVGNILMLADYCGKNIRVVSSTGKKYFLTVKDRSIDFGVGLSGNVRLEVFDYVGNSVLVVSDGALEAGEYSAALDLPVGVYYCRLRAGLYEQVGKVLIAR
ncbi:MAG: PKD domain-containing protein [Candidatus Kapaibacterium sp.]